MSGLIIDDVSMHFGGIKASTAFHSRSAADRSAA